MSPTDILIVKRRDDGSGVVELPILAEASIYMGLTASAQDKHETITVSDLQNAAENAAGWPGPLPVTRQPHRKTFSETADKADGFIDRLWVNGKQLMARIDLTASLFAEVVARQWRGFSVDFFRGIKLPTSEFKGFTVVGGVFTNRPAAPVHFKLEGLFAGAVTGDGGCSFLSLRLESAEVPMPEPADLSVKLATAEAEALSLKDQKISLETKLAEAKAENASLEARVSTAEKAAEGARAESMSAKQIADRAKSEAKDAETRIASLETERKDLRAQLAIKQDEAVAAKVSSMCRGAIKEGVPPAQLSAFGDWEKEPLKWLRSTFASLEAAETFVKAMPRGANLGPVKSDRSDDDAQVLSATQADEMRKLGLDPRYASVRNERDALALREQIAREQNAAK